VESATTFLASLRGCYKRRWTWQEQIRADWADENGYFLFSAHHLTQFLQRIGATKRYGDEDVWDLTFNSGKAEVEYVHVREFDKKLTYAGWVEAFSETEKLRELRLRDVIVYDFEGNILFETPRVYLARRMDNIDIEFPYRSGTAE
jgi:hypothetical protein